MPRAQWSLKQGRPVIKVTLCLAQGGPKVTRTLLADTGAGTTHAPFELLLDEDDCLLCGTGVSYMVSLGGAYAGSYPVYLVHIEIASLGIASDFRAVGVPTPPQGLDGIAGFGFLNRFTYGNFGGASSFGLEL